MMFSKILIVQTAYIGDMMFTTPLLKKVRKLYPEASITLLTTPQNHDLMKDSTFVDRFIVYDKRGRDRGLRGFARVAGEVREEEFDLLISPHRSVRTGLLSLLSGTRERIGFKNSFLSGLFYKKLVPYNPAREKSFVKQKLALLSQVSDEKSNDLKMVLTLNPELVSNIQNLLEGRGIHHYQNGRFKICTLIMGSLGKQKIWPKGHYIDLVRTLINREVSVALIGGVTDRKNADDLIERVRSGGDRTDRIHNFCGRFNLRQSAALMSLSSVFVGSDTGPLHMARALDVPHVALFGPTDPEQFERTEGISSFLHTDLDCAPCSPHGRNRCDKTIHCMDTITPSAVCEEIEKLVPEIFLGG